MSVSPKHTMDENASVFEKIKKYIKEKPVKVVLMILGNLVLAGFLSMCVKALIALPNIINGAVENPISLNPLELFKAMFLSPFGYIFLVVLVFAEWYVWKYVILPRTKIKTGVDDERGFTYSEKGTYGTSYLEAAENMSNIIDVGPVKDTKGIILGKPLYSDTSNINLKSPRKEKEKLEVITLPSDEEYDAKVKKFNWQIDDIINNKLNKHIAVFGASGTMKTRAVARNFIMQSVRREESFIATDPKGELYEDMAEFCRKKGYNVKMFNLVNQEYSDSWNCLAEILNPDGTVNTTSAKIFADTIVTNASGEQDYWSDNARNLLKAVCILVAQDPYLPTNIGTVYDIISQKTPAEIDALFKQLDPNDVARRAYNIFGVCTDQVKGQIANGLGIMLDVFQDQHIRNITSYKEIDLELPAVEKCAYFIITSDQHKVFDFLSVLLYAMLFIKLVEKIDRARQVGREGMSSSIPVNLILDEFPNIGQIPDFTKKISTVRSRNINITIIFQNIVQMQNRYPYGAWEEILGNCDTKIFLGCTDQTTAKYISEQTGIASIEVTTQNKSYEADQPILNQGVNYHEVSSVGQRKVLNPDEVLSIKNTQQLVFLRGQKPFMAKKFDYTLHPDAEDIEAKSIFDHIPAWKQKMIDEETERQKQRDEIRKANEEKEQEELQKIEQKKQDIQNDWNNLFSDLNNSNSDLARSTGKKAPKRDKKTSPFGRKDERSDKSIQKAEDKAKEIQIETKEMTNNDNIGGQPIEAISVQTIEDMYEELDFDDFDLI